MSKSTALAVRESEEEVLERMNRELHARRRLLPQRGQQTREEEPRALPICARCRAVPARSIEVLGQPLAVSPHCQECDDALARERAVAAARRREAERAERARSREENITRVMKGCSFNMEEYSDATLDNFDPRPDRQALSEAHLFATRFLAGTRPAPGIYLYSKRPGQRIATGAGKTHLAHAIGRQVLLDPGTDPSKVRIFYMPKLLLRMRATFGKHPTESLDDILAQIGALDLAIFDDLGVHNWSEWTVETLNIIAEERVGKATVWTSNLTTTEVVARALEKDPTNGEDIARLVSRIEGSSTIVALHGPDRRLSA